MLTIAVSIKTELTFVCNSRIKLAQTASSGIARVGEGFAAIAFRFSIQLSKGGFRHVNLATDFENASRRSII